jgi:hypothetical protein
MLYFRDYVLLAGWHACHKKLLDMFDFKDYRDIKWYLKCYGHPWYAVYKYRAYRQSLVMQGQSAECCIIL